ncbi:MAG: glycosyltransferase family 4 protein [Candidatus Micrarchaeota archaeon]|nr:glycosyltransferase family 4 protein [Candidatus Micrarchaeota archaeon]
MKVLFTTDTYHPNVDGVVKTLDLLERELEKYGIEVYILAPEGSETKENVHLAKALPFLPYPDYKIPLPFELEFEVDIVHNHGITITAWEGLIYGRKKNIPVIGTYHTDVIDATHYVNLPKEVAARYIRTLYKRHDITLAPSYFALKKLMKRTKLRNGFVFPNPIDTSEFIQSKQKSPFLLHVGRLVKEKRIDLIFPYLEKVGMPLYVAGKGPALEYYKKLAESYNAEIHFLGYVPDEELKQLYAKATALVFNSSFDTQGLVCLEALASGTPVVAYKETAFAEIAEKLGTVFWDELSFIKAVKQATTIPQSKLLSIAKKYDIQVLGKKIVKLYELMLERELYKLL